MWDSDSHAKLPLESITLIGREVSLETDDAPVRQGRIPRSVSEENHHEN